METEQAKRSREATYKERLAADVDRAGGWQGPLLRDAARELRAPQGKP